MQLFSSLAAAVLLVSSSVHGRNINAEGLALIKSFEGFRGNFYLDSVGVKTIGYGHACHVHDCSRIHEPLSEAQASQLLLEDMQSYANCVEQNVPGLDDDKFAALTSFTYNLGCGALASSDMVKFIRAHNIKAAAAEFPLWVHAGGRVLPGLVRRREAERHLFCKSGGC